MHLKRYSSLLAMLVVVGGCGISFVLPSAGAEEGKIPALAFPSSRLYEEDQAGFARRRQALLAQLAEFQAAARAFNAKTAEAQTDAEFNALEGSRRNYLAAAAAFNRDVAAAEARAMRRADLPVARVAAVEGEVSFITKDGHTLKGTQGGALVLEAGTRILVGPSGRLQVLLPDETVFTLGPRSDMVLDEFVYDPATSTTKTMAALAKGIFRFISGKAKYKDIHLKLWVGDLGFRGTDCECNIDPDGSGHIKLFEGQVDITERQTARIVVLNAGQMVTFTAAGTFSSPTPLAPGK